MGRPGNRESTGRHRGSKKYKDRLSYLKSALTGIQEYGSNHFCGKLRNDLLMSKSKGIDTTRVAMDKLGRVKVSGIPHRFLPQGGIRLIDNVHVDVFYPQYFRDHADGMLVHRPRVKSRAALNVVNVLPFRHGRNGRTPLTIGGWGFKQGARVLVGGVDCPVKRISRTEIVCIVPAATRGASTVSVSVVVHGQRSTLDRAVLYMNV